MSSAFTKKHTFYGYKIIQNPSIEKLALYMGGIDAKILRDLVSVDNAVGWDSTSNIWKAGGRNRLVIDAHWQEIKEFLSSSNLERILPSAIVISVEGNAFSFKPFAAMPAIDTVLPGEITIDGRYVNLGDGEVEPAEEKMRSAWVLDGQHRIKAFREWSMPEPYPVNVTIIKAWAGPDYEDAMRHQTYELNMGRPLSDDFKAAVREQYTRQIGHKAYKRQIAYSWIRKNIEERGAVFSPNGIVGAPTLRTPYVITMSFVEKVIATAFDSDPYLQQNYVVEKLDPQEVADVGKYLYDFFEGVRLSIGLINPNVKGTIGSEPEVAAANDYWDIATKTKHKQRLLHNVGLIAVTRGLLNKVMRSDKAPKSPTEVAELLEHMRGIPWHDDDFQSKKDDWTGPLATALASMHESKGTAGGKKYQLKLEKKHPSGNVYDTFNLTANGWS